MARHVELRPIRIVIYLSGLLYGLVSILGEPARSELLDNNLFNSPEAAAVVGIIQLLAILLGLVVDFTGNRWRRLVKPIFLVLTVTYLYEGVLLLTNVVEPFRWIPLFVYGSICAVVYLSEE